MSLTTVTTISSSVKSLSDYFADKAKPNYVALPHPKRLIIDVKVEGNKRVQYINYRPLWGVELFLHRIGFCGASHYRNIVAFCAQNQETLTAEIRENLIRDIYKYNSEHTCIRSTMRVNVDLVAKAIIANKTKEQALVLALTNGREQEAGLLLDVGADPTTAISTNGFELSCFEYACFKGLAGFFQRCLDKKISGTLATATLSLEPHDFALVGGHHELCRELRRFKNHTHRTLFDLFSANFTQSANCSFLVSQIDAVTNSHIIESFANNPDIRKLFVAACKAHCMPFIKALAKACRADTPAAGKLKEALYDLSKYSESPMHAALEAGDQTQVLATVKYLSVEFNDLFLHKRDAQQNNPLHAAANGASAQVVAYLLQRGAGRWEVNSQGKTPYDIATARSKKDPQVEKLLLTTSEDKALIDAVNENDAEKVLAQIKAGANPHAEVSIDGKRISAFNYASLKRWKEVLQLCIDTNIDLSKKPLDSFSAVEFALLSANPEIFELVREHTGEQHREIADLVDITLNQRSIATIDLLATIWGKINDKAMEAIAKDPKQARKFFWMACYKQCLPFATLCLNHPQLKTELAKADKYTPHNPLRDAVSRKGYSEVVTFLASQTSAFINAPDINKDTPLHVALAEGHFQYAEVLLQNGADTSLKGCNSLTPLHIAAQEAPVELIQLLLNRGADASTQTPAGETPLQIAMKRKQRDPKIEALLTPTPA